MTEIKIEKKKTIWPWLLLALIILAIILYFLFFRNNNNADKVAVTNTDTAATMALIDKHENNNMVATYIAFINADTAHMAVDHSYSSEALLKLIQATRAMAGEVGFDVKVDLDSAANDANQIKVNPDATNHADLIKKTATLIGSSLKNLQQAKYPTLSIDADEVTNAASAIGTDTLTLDQKQNVKMFFDKAANLLQKMN